MFIVIDMMTINASERVEGVVYPNIKEALKACILPKDVEVKLNDTHIATVSNDGNIKIDDIKFPVSVLDDLMNAVKMLNKEAR